MDGAAENKCYWAGKNTDRPHPGPVRRVECKGVIEYCCKNCAPAREKEQADYLAWKADRTKNPLGEDELRAAVQALGDLTGAEVLQIQSQQINNKDASPAQKQIWAQVLDDHNARVATRGFALIKDLVIGATYRVRYWDADRIPERGRMSLNLTANAVSAGVAAVKNAAHEIRGDVITGELVTAHWNVVHIGYKSRSLLGSKRTNEIPVYTARIASIELVDLNGQTGLPLSSIDHNFSQSPDFTNICGICRYARRWHPDADAESASGEWHTFVFNERGEFRCCEVCGESYEWHGPPATTDASKSATQDSNGKSATQDSNGKSSHSGL